MQMEMEAGGKMYVLTLQSLVPFLRLLAGFEEDGSLMSTDRGETGSSTSSSPFATTWTTWLKHPNPPLPNLRGRLISTLPLSSLPTDPPTLSIARRTTGKQI